MTWLSRLLCHRANPGREEENKPGGVCRVLQDTSPRRLAAVHLVRHHGLASRPTGFDLLSFWLFSFCLARDSNPSRGDWSRFHLRVHTPYSASSKEKQAKWVEQNRWGLAKTSPSSSSRVAACSCSEDAMRARRNSGWLAAQGINIFSSRDRLIDAC